MHDDPVLTNPELYHVEMENERVRVLEYRDRPGDKTTPHDHPDSVMVTLSAFRRRLSDGTNSTDMAFEPGLTRWLAAQRHVGENIGDSETHVIFVELEEPKPASREPAAPPPLGPTEV